MTLSDKEYQVMRVEYPVLTDYWGRNRWFKSSFAVNPNTGRCVIVEMNPRVSRSSALASKATGFPIAKVAAKLAVGYTLDEIQTILREKQWQPLNQQITLLQKFQGLILKSSICIRSPWCSNAKCG